MAQRTAIDYELKRVLKVRAMSYAALVRELKFSLASLKRIFSAADFSLERIDALSRSGAD